MSVQKIELGSKGIRRVLRKYKPEEASGIRVEWI